MADDSALLSQYEHALDGWKQGYALKLGDSAANRDRMVQLVKDAADVRETAQARADQLQARVEALEQPVPDGVVTREHRGLASFIVIALEAKELSAAGIANQLANLEAAAYARGLEAGKREGAPELDCYRLDSDKLGLLKGDG